MVSLCYQINFLSRIQSPKTIEQPSSYSLMGKVSRVYEFECVFFASFLKVAKSQEKFSTYDFSFWTISWKKFWFQVLLMKKGSQFSLQFPAIRISFFFLGKLKKRIFGHYKGVRDEIAHISILQLEEDGKKFINFIDYPFLKICTNTICFWYESAHKSETLPYSCLFF